MERLKLFTPENFDFPIQTSLYGTSKVAAEGLITSYANMICKHGFLDLFLY